MLDQNIHFNQLALNDFPCARLVRFILYYLINGRVSLELLHLKIDLIFKTVELILQWWVPFWHCGGYSKAKDHRTWSSHGFLYNFRAIISVVRYIYLDHTEWVNKKWPDPSKLMPIIVSSLFGIFFISIGITVCLVFALAHPFGWPEKSFLDYVPSWVQFQVTIQ